MRIPALPETVGNALIYVGLIGLTIGGVWWYAIHGTSIFQGGSGASGRGGLALVLLYVGPLVIGLSARQLGGVLAHEFGHFSQGFGMRVSYIVRTISYWFARVVYERDRWDEWLASTASSLDFRIGIVLHFSRLLIWLTRRILWCLMMIGQIFSCYLLRQMEFEEAFGDELKPAMLVPVEQLVQHKTATLEANLAMRRLFGNHFSVPRHMVFQVVFEASADANDGFETLRSRLLSARTAIIKLLPEYVIQSKAFDELDSRWLMCHFPFEHADGRLSLSQYMLPKLPAKDDVAEVLGGAEKLVENYHYVYFRSIGALAHICQRIEGALGFEPQPVPPHEEKSSEEHAAVGL